MSSLDDLERKQQKMATKAAALANEQDPEKIIATAEQLAEQAKELEALARSIEAANAPNRPPANGETRVLLTADQRERIAEATGMGMEVVIMPGSADEWARKMATIEPRIVEAEAFKQVADRVLLIEKRKAMQNVLKELEKAIGDEPLPETKAALDELREQVRKLK